MRTILSTLGMCAALVMCVVSGAMNYLFLSSLGKTALEGQVLGAASAAADILKDLMPFFIAWSWQARRFVAALAGSLAFAFFAAFSFFSALGFAADNRGALVEGREALTATYKSVQAEQAALEARLTALPPHRPAPVVREDLESHKQNRRWSATKDCTDATEAESRAYCARYFKLRAELAAGTEVESLTGKIAALKSEASRLRDAGAGQVTDPQVSLLSRIFGQASEPVRLALTIAIALLVEIGASLGLFLASGHGVAKPTSAPPASIPQTGSVEDFCLEALMPAKSGAVSVEDLFAAYRDWCREREFGALNAAQFKATFTGLAASIGIPEEAGGFRGIAVAGPAGDERMAA
ncbi:hypothetical protein [Hyphomicrobium sp. NDB2Meth4]|uniref:hypothetical protein n=1 Tax=Hyphomicrobium sp. NDB2Meth4 TaxID=1892846 RepID=UPI000A915C80|nr:hypothetical protein [Hyphomicrobium sp. NDB2Meth4]